MATPKLPSAPPLDEDFAGGHMTFWEHLQELRVRLIRMVLGFFLGAAVAWYFKEQLLLVLTQPYIEGWPDEATRPSLHFSDPAGLFVSYVKISILGGLILSLPLQLYQVWAFVAPGLYAKEKWIAGPFVVISTALFCTGSYFGWRIVFPVAFQYLLSYAQIPLDSALTVQPTVMIESYLAFVTRALLAFGAVFEIPVVVFFLSLAGVIDHTHMIKFARYFVVIAFIVSAIITPPDPLSQLLLAAPLILLYTLSIGIAWLVTKRPWKKAT